MSEKTIDNYRKQILYWNRYLDEVCDVQEVEKVRPIHIKNFIILKEKDKRKPAYINDLLKAYRSFFNYCVEEEYIDESPLAKVKNVKEPRVIINTFTLTDIKRCWTIIAVRIIFRCAIGRYSPRYLILVYAVRN